MCTLFYAYEGNEIKADSNMKKFLRATYLRPLRDAEQELSSKKGSRLSQVLINHRLLDEKQKTDINDQELAYSQIIEILEGNDDKEAIINALESKIAELNGKDHITAKEHIVRIIEDANEKISKLNAISSQNTSIQGYLKNMTLANETYESNISASKSNLRNVLEKFELNLNEKGHSNNAKQGLGVNNLLFMATESILMENSEQYSLPLLLIEESEAHLHPQYQLRLINFLENDLAKDQNMQVIMTSHSPTLASKIDLEKIILCKDGKAFSMHLDYTELEKGDYQFLQRFLDSSKSNLFFANGVIIVEGDAEYILLPVLAQLLGYPLDKYGVSIVNVGHTGLFRYSRIFMRKRKENSECRENMGVKVACITDLDIPPQAALEIKDYLKEVDQKRVKVDVYIQKEKKKRRSTGIITENENDFDPKKLSQEDQQFLTDFQKFENIETFVSPQWTLEFDIANTQNGLQKELYTAILTASSADKMTFDKKPISKTVEADFKKWEVENLSSEKIACEIYKRLYNGTSKAETAQYFANILEKEYKNADEIKRNKLEGKLPEYLVKAIKHAVGELNV